MSDYTSFRKEVVECLSSTLHITMDEADNLTGDIVELYDDELCVTEATDAIIDAMRASA